MNRLAQMSGTIIVKIENPILCIRCKFRSTAHVELSDGTSKQMFHCTRGDCDNWQRTDEEPKVERFNGEAIS